jgi:predicted RNA-binding Zn-ribbon protein involved in translation (DUF1610 family)
MPVCIKCGGQIAEGGKFCPNCGAKVVVPKPPRIKEAREIGERAFGAPDLLSLIGALALLVGPFLSWMDVLGFPAQGLDFNQGIVLYVMGALCLAAVIIARNLGRISGLVYVGLALCAGAIVGHFVYQIFDADIDWGDVAVGFYVAGAGAVLVLLGGISRLLTKTA